MNKNDKKRSKWLPPENYRHFFDPVSDYEFKSRHPIGYGFVVFLGITVLLLSSFVFCLLVNKDSEWMILGVVGGFIFGIGLFNFVAIILKTIYGAFGKHFIIFNRWCLDVCNLAYVSIKTETVL